MGTTCLRPLPEEMGELTGLRDFLYLHDNRLTELPGSLGGMTALRYLNVSENLLERFPEAICRMTGLMELRISDNRIAELPAAIGGLTRLREMHLRNNGLETLPEEIGGLRELRQLDLRGNPLTSLPESLMQMPRLEKIDLRWVGDAGRSGVAWGTGGAGMPGLSLGGCEEGSGFAEEVDGIAWFGEDAGGAGHAGSLILDTGEIG